MLKEIFDKAASIDIRIKYFETVEKYLNNTGVRDLLNPELVKQFGETSESLKDILLPIIQNQIAQLKSEFDLL